MKISRSTSLRDVAFTVCTALHDAGVEAVLTGGSAATVYAPRAHQSRDLDFIITFRKSVTDAGGVLESMGYRQVHDHYEHMNNPLILEFPGGPLAIGGELIVRWNTMRKGRRLLNIITPTDCVRDRLAGFLFWHDRGSLDQALAVSRTVRDDIDMGVVRRWCRKEGKDAEWREFERALSPRA